MQGSKSASSLDLAGPASPRKLHLDPVIDPASADSDRSQVVDAENLVARPVRGGRTSSIVCT